MTVQPTGTPGYLRWTLDDKRGNTYVMAINPNVMSSPWHDVNVTTHATTAPTGQVLIIEGAFQPKEFTISGVSFSPEQYASLVFFLRNKRRLDLYDHWGRKMVVFITRLDLKPKRRTTWKHDWEMTMILLQEPTPVSTPEATP